MDYKNLKQAKWAFRFNQPLIKLYRIDPITGEETFMGDDWISGMWRAYTWSLDETKKTWVSIKVKKDKILFWVKEVISGDKKAEAKHYQIVVEKHDEQKVAIGDPDEMIKSKTDGTWQKKNLTN